MKQVEYVSIGGYMFSIEEDACSAVRNYLDELSSFYSTKESGSEVMEGIEERMSELLLEKCGQGGVVTLSMVQSVMETLGKPEAIEEESGESDSEPTGKEGKESKEGGKIRKRLYRDPSSGKLAGVCSGLGQYFGIDPTLFRILFAIFTLIGIGTIVGKHWIFPGDLTFPLIYLILWLCMPVARTVSQRDELRGEGGTVDDISARVRSSVQEIGETAGSVVHSDSLKGLWRIFAVCIGIVLLVAGVAGVVSLGVFTLDDTFLSGSFFINRILENIATDAPVMLDMISNPVFVASLAVVVVLPFIWMIYAGVMLIFDLKAPGWHPGACLLVIWLIALTVLAVLSAMVVLKGTL